MVFGTGLRGTVDMGAVVGDMEANGIQRTPIANRTMGMTGVQPGSAWRQPGTGQPRHNPQRQPFNAAADRSFRSNTTRSDRSDSATEVENLLSSAARQPVRGPGSAWPAPQARTGQPVQRGKKQ